MGLFQKIKEGLKKTRDSIVGQIDSMLKSFTKIDEELFEELEELLVMGDVGLPTAQRICEELRKCVSFHVAAVYAVVIQLKFQKDRLEFMNLMPLPMINIFLSFS